jgi:hypothetical protein
MLIEYAPGHWVNSYRVVAIRPVSKGSAAAQLDNAHCVVSLVTGKTLYLTEKEYQTFITAAQLTGAIQIKDIQALPKPGFAIADLYKAETQDGSDY